MDELPPIYIIDEPAELSLFMDIRLLYVVCIVESETHHESEN